MSHPITNGHIFSIIKKVASDPEADGHPEARKYSTKFRDMEQTFFSDVHPLVDVGLAMSEVLVAKGGAPNIFTFHGVRHVSELISNMDKICKSIETDNEANRLSYLEAYLLLCAAHIHDVANISGRADHPSRCSEMLEKYKGSFCAPEINQINQVASAHGGKSKQYGRDTIREVDSDNQTDPRLSLLAAILRLSDELSESPDRVPELLEKTHEHAEESRLAFEYARSFAKFEFRKGTLYLNYNLYKSALIAEFKENKTGKTSFVDFLELKLDLIEKECRYCSQYGQPQLFVSKISIVIQAYAGDAGSKPEKKTTFSLNLNHGYPGDMSTLCMRSPELTEKKIEHLAECFPRQE